MALEDVAVPGVETAPPDTAIEIPANTMADSDGGSIVITKNDAPVGIVTDRDLALAVPGSGADPADLTARDVTPDDLVGLLVAALGNLADIERTLSVNLLGPILLSRRAIPFLLDGPGGRAVNVSSGDGAFDDVQGGHTGVEGPGTPPTESRRPASYCLLYVFAGSTARRRGDAGLAFEVRARGSGRSVPARRVPDSLVVVVAMAPGDGVTF